MSVRVLTYPGYIASWGSTSQWSRPPEGPFVVYCYTRPDDERRSVRTETFCASYAEAEYLASAWARALRLLS